MSTNLQIHIPEPCHQVWDTMQPEEGGRFCASCVKKVVDFSLMSDREVLSYLADSKGGVCGRFLSDQLDKNILPPPEHKRSGRGIWNFLVVTLLVGTKAEAQSTPVRAPVSQCDSSNSGNDLRAGLTGDAGLTGKTQMPGDARMTGEVVVVGRLAYGAAHASDFALIRVIDSASGLPLAGATVRIGDTKKYFSTDALGEVRIAHKDIRIAKSLEVSSISYMEKKIMVTRDLRELSVSGYWPILLSPQFTTLPPSTVISYGTTTGRLTLGGAMLVRRTSLLTIVKDTLTSLVVPKREWSVYPNPAPRGTTVSIAMQSERSETSQLQLLNASGALMQVKQIGPGGKGQVELLNIPASLSAGIYFIRLARPGGEKVVTQKLLVL